MRIDLLVRNLEDGTLPPSGFSHRNHVHVAWHYLQQRPLPQAAGHFAAVLRAYVARIGAADKFHLTLTMAFMHLIQVRRLPDENWEAFALRNPELFEAARSLIARHYSPEALERGRKEFVEPDLEPLP